HSATSILGVGFGVFPRPLLLLTDEGDAPAHTVIRRDEVLRTQPAARAALCACLPGGELRAQGCWKRARCLRHPLTVLPVSATDGAVQREWGEAAVLGECGGVLAGGRCHGSGGADGGFWPCEVAVCDTCGCGAGSEAALG